jgi:hypothetical protein
MSTAFSARQSAGAVAREIELAINLKTTSVLGLELKERVHFDYVYTRIASSTLIHQDFSYGNRV